VADGVAADMEVAAWVAITGAVPAPDERVEPLFCPSGPTK
jgi:hypothetical protein